MQTLSRSGNDIESDMQRSAQAPLPACLLPACLPRETRPCSECRPETRTLYTRFSMVDVLMRVVTLTISPLSFFLYSITVLTPLASGPVTEPTGISFTSSSSRVSAHLIFDAMLGNLQGKGRLMRVEQPASRSNRAPERWSEAQSTHSVTSALVSNTCLHKVSDVPGPLALSKCCCKSRCFRISRLLQGRQVRCFGCLLHALDYQKTSGGEKHEVVV